MGQCGCLDREKDKQRILEQLSANIAPPLPKYQEHTRNRYEIKQRYSYNNNKASQFSSKAGHLSYHSDTLSYMHITQNNQFILISRIELQQFIRTNQQRIDQVILNPFNQHQCLISFDQNDVVDPIVSEFLIRESSFNQLYMALKDFIASQEKKIVGLVPESTHGVRIFYRTLSQRQAIHNSIEMQMCETVQQASLEEIINERLLDNLICCNILQLGDTNLLFFQSSKRTVQTINVIQLDLNTLNAHNLSQEIAGKVEMLQNNDEFEYVSLLSDVKKKAFYILMSIKQL